MIENVLHFFVIYCLGIIVAVVLIGIDNIKGLKKLLKNKEYGTDTKVEICIRKFLPWYVFLSWYLVLLWLIALLSYIIEWISERL